MVFTVNYKWMTLWRYAVLLCFCHSKKRVHLFIYLLIYVIKGSLFDWYCHVVVSHNQHKVWIKAFQIFLKKFIMRENFFARITKFKWTEWFQLPSKNLNHLQLDRYKKKWIKYLYRFLIELICLFFIIDSTVLLNVFYLVNLEIWPFYEYLNLQVLSFF